MSLFNTIAHDGAVRARGFSPRAGMVAAGLVVAVAVGFAVVNSVTAEEPSDASAGVTDQFIRINTTDLQSLTPASGAAAKGSAGVTDQFIRINTTDLQPLTPASGAAAKGSAGVTDQFIRINTTDLQSLTLASGAAAKGSADSVNPKFWYLNTTALEYPISQYGEVSSGPR